MNGMQVFEPHDVIDSPPRTGGTAPAGRGLFGLAGSVCLLILMLAPAAPPVAAQEPGVDLFGEFRVRPEWDWRTAAVDGDAATLVRTRLGVRVPIEDFARIVIQIQDSRAFGEETSTLTDASADQLDLHQTYIELFDDELLGVPALVRVGRQEIILGTERLVGAVGWTNTARSFDGARAIVGPADGAWSVTAFASVIDERDAVGATGLDPRANEGRDLDHAFFGAWGSVGVLDLYILHQRNAAFRTVSGVDRATAGVRLHGAAGGFGYDVEAAYQFGEQLLARGDELRNQDIEAWLATGRVSWSSGAATGFRALRFGLDWLSGDDAPFDEDYGAFNTLFATNHKWYGFMDLFLDPAGQTGERGLVDGIAGFDLGITDRLAFSATGHGFWFAEEAGAPDRNIGWEIDLTLPYRLGESGSIQGGYGVFFAGDGAGGAGLGPPDEVLHWAYIQLRLGFDTPLDR